MVNHIPKNAESPLKRYFDNFDVEHMGWTPTQYKNYAIQQTDVNLTQLLLDDWRWRASHKQNIVASSEGDQGTGKSLFLGAGSILCSKIFGKSFYTPESDEMLKKNLSFDSETMDAQLDASEERVTKLNDEHRKNKVGIMANMIEASLEEKEDQLRKHQINMFFASPDLQDHKHFFVFEMKHIVFNEDGFPKATVAMLKTKLYTDRSQFVWHGYVSFPVPPKDYLSQYDALKDEHIIKLKQKYGNTLDPVIFHANEIFKKCKDNLIVTSSDGYVKPIPHKRMYKLVAREIGTRKFTTGGYSLLLDEIKDIIVDAYAKENEVIRQKQADKAEELKEAKIRKFETMTELAREKKEARLELFKLKMEEQKRKNDLKERAILLKEKQQEAKLKKKAKK